MKSKSEKHRYTSARERADKKSTGFQAPYLNLPTGVSLFKPKAGTMLLDILPYVAGAGNPSAEEGMVHFERTFYVHRGIGPNSDTFLCARRTLRKRCPVCEHRASLQKDNDDGSKDDLIKDLGPKERQLFNVFNTKEPDKGIQVWDMSYHLFGEDLDARIRNSEDEDGWDRFHALEGGHTLRVAFIEDAFSGRKFLRSESIDFKPRKEDYGEDTLESVCVLDDLLVVPDFNELKKTLLQIDEETEEAGEEADGAPARPVRRLPKRATEEPEEEPEEAPATKRPVRSLSRTEPEEEPEEVEEAPTLRKSKRAAEPEPEEEDADWSQFEEKPAKKKAAAPVEEEEEEPAPRASKHRPESEEEPEEEEAPKKGSRFARQKGDRGFDAPEEEETEPAPRPRSRR